MHKISIFWNPQTKHFTLQYKLKTETHSTARKSKSLGYISNFNSVFLYVVITLTLKQINWQIASLNSIINIKLGAPNWINVLAVWIVSESGILQNQTLVLGQTCTKITIIAGQFADCVKVVRFYSSAILREFDVSNEEIVHKRGCYKLPLNLAVVQWI